MSLSNLRQGAQKVSQNSGAGKGGKGGFFNKFRVPKLTNEIQNVLRPNEPPGDPILLVRPETPYDDVYDVDEAGNSRGTKTDALHFLRHSVQAIENGKTRYGDITCTAGPNAHAPQPCVGCAAHDGGNKSVGGSSQQWAWNIKHLVPYHEVPLMDKRTNQIVMKKDKNEPVTVLQACQVGSPSERAYHMKNGQVQQCEHCARNMPLKFGAPKVYQLGKKHLDDLLLADQTLEHTCAKCMTRLIKVAFGCVGCGKDILDLSQTQLTNDQLRAFAATHQRCGHCGMTNFPKTIYECGYDPTGMYQIQGGCPDGVEPAPLSIFDVVFYVYRQGDDTQSKLVISPPIPINRFRTPTGNDLENWLKSPHLSKSFDLNDMYKTVSLDEQARVLRVPNPYAPQQAQPSFQQYGGQAPQQGGFPAPQQYGGMLPQQPGYAPALQQYGGQPAPQQQQPANWQQPQPQQQAPYAPYPTNQPQQPQQQPSFPNVPFNGRPDFGK